MIDVLTLGRTVVRAEGSATIRAADLLDASFSAAVTRLRAVVEGGGTIIATGAGKSGHVARRFVATLRTIGVRAEFLHPNDGLHGEIGTVRAGDAVLALSLSGKTAEVIAIVRLAASRGASTVAVVGDAETPLGELAEVSIATGVEPEAAHAIPTVTCAVQGAIVDALVVGLIALCEIEAGEVLRNHPAGLFAQKMASQPGSVWTTSTS